MNPCKISPKSANTQTSWILYLNVTPSQETQSHNSLSAPSASGERQKPQELKRKPTAPNFEVIILLLKDKPEICITAVIFLYTINATATTKSIARKCIFLLKVAYLFICQCF